jgi:hypothetical protein
MCHVRQNQFSPDNMKKTIGVLCIAISIASLGWKLTQGFMTLKSESSLIDIGYLRVRDGIDSPLNHKIDLGIYIAASTACLLAAIALLKKEKA